MKKYKLDAQERKIEAAIGRGEYVPVTGRELRKVADAVAARKRDRTLTIRVNSADIERIKRMAASRGIPYQSYLSELIHRVAMTL